MKIRKKSIKGQAIVEHIIIIVIVTIAALTVLCLFGDRIRLLLGGTLLSISNSANDKTAVHDLVNEKTQKGVKDMTVHGIKNPDGTCNDGFQ